MNLNDSHSSPASPRSMPRIVGWLAVAFLVFVMLGGKSPGCQNSFTPKPHCPAGWHVEHAPSHQGHVWDCVADNGSGRVPG